MNPAELPPAEDGSLVFAQLSDPHLTSLEGIAPTSLRDKRLLGWLSWRRRRRFRHDPDRLADLVADARAQGIEHWVVTGDLTHISLPSELEAARDWLASLGPADAVSAIPGNHDLYVADEDRTMHRLWAPWMRSDDGSDGFPWLRMRGPAALIGLDSAWPASPLTATGHLGNRQLEALEDLLERTGRAGYARIVLVHHAPAPGLDPWRKRLVDARALSEVLGRAGTELVLHGHGHALRVLRLTDARATPVVQAPSSSATTPDGAHRASWIRCAIHRRAGDLEIEVEARAAGTTLARHVFEFPSG